MSFNDLTILVERAKAGDRAAFGTIFDRFQTEVFGVAMARLRNQTEAQELTQEVFVHAMEKIHQLREAACLKSWLCQITVRMAINRLTRKGLVKPTKSEVLDNVSAAGREPLDDIVRAEQRATIWGGLDRLKPIDRATLEAHYLRGHSLDRMSRDFEAPVGTIKRRLHVARKRLRLQLEGSSPNASETELAGV
jgi:RNA polymerase sigma-70 factor (ECF subfamily)